MVRVPGLSPGHRRFPWRAIAPSGASGASHARTPAIGVPYLAPGLVLLLVLVLSLSASPLPMLGGPEGAAGTGGPRVSIGALQWAAGASRASETSAPSTTGALASERAGPAPSAPSATAAVVSCTLNEGLPTTLTSTFNTSLPPSPFQPSPCTLSENLSVTAPSGSLVVSGVNGVTVVATTWNQSLWMDVAGNLIIGPGSFFNVAVGSSLHLAVQGSVLVEPGGNLTLSSGSTLLLGLGSELTIDGGVLYTRGALLEAGGGSVDVRQGGVLEGSPMGPTPSPGPSRIAHLNVAGSLSALNDSGSLIRWVNVSGGVGSIELLGASSSAPIVVQNVTVSQASLSFRADDAALADVVLSSVGTLALGNLSASSDIVTIDGLTVAGSIPFVLLAHAQVSAMSLSSATEVVLENSTFSPGASSITSVTSSFSANQSSHFGFPMVFNNAPWVNITNSTAPAVAVLGGANVSLYNWWVRTNYSGGTSAFLPNITTISAQVAVHVYRYVLVSVTPGPPAVATSSVALSLCSTAPNLPCHHLGVDSQGEAGRFLLTDVVTLAGLDAFVGVYDASATAAGGYSAAPVTVQVTQDNQRIVLTMTTPPVAPELVPFFLLEVAGIGVVVGAIVLLRAQTRRLERPKRVGGKSSRSSGKRAEESPTPVAEAKGGPATPETKETGSGATTPAATAQTSDRRPPAREWKPPIRPS